MDFSHLLLWSSKDSDIEFYPSTPLFKLRFEAFRRRKTGLAYNVWEVRRTPACWFRTLVRRTCGRCSRQHPMVS